MGPDALIDELLTHYETLDETFKADLPLKRIWAFAEQEDSE
jgi:predicted Mrr-cat superfamily restriction endonuclease